MTKLEEQIKKSENLKSKLTEEILAIEGMSSPKTKHLLNNLCTNSSNWLEIGSYRGCTLIAAAYQNINTRIWAVDNFSQFDHQNTNKGILYGNIKKHVPSSNITFLNMDFKELSDSPNIRDNSLDVLFYDGEHTEQAQYDGLSITYKLMKDEFICLVDDWNFPEVEIGTLRAIKDLNLNVLEQYILPANFNGDVENWWNGLFVARMKKT